MNQVILGGISFDAGAGITRSRHGWGLQDITDWLSLTSTKAELMERPQAHGAFDPGTDWRSGGVYTLTLAYIGDSVADLEAAIMELTSLGGIDSLLSCDVTLGGITTHRMVEIASIDVPSHHMLSRLSNIQVDLKAPDPFAYGDSVSVSTGLPARGGGLAFPLAFPVNFGVPGVEGRVRFTNSGTAPAPVTMMVSGGLSEGFQLKRVETGDLITFRRPVAPTDVVTLNTADGTAFLNGSSPVSGFLTDDDWWLVGKKETCTVQFTALGDVTGSPSLSMTAAPAFF